MASTHTKGGFRIEFGQRLSHLINQAIETHLAKISKALSAVGIFVQKADRAGSFAGRGSSVERAGC